jgi:hypothetical protein
MWRGEERREGSLQESLNVLNIIVFFFFALSPSSAKKLL